MKIVQFSADGSVLHGVLEENILIPLEGAIFTDFSLDRQHSYKLEEVTILPPVGPSKIIAVGINYRDHAEEFGHEIPAEPVLFMKPSTAVIGHNDEIVYPPSAGQVDYEAEIAAVVGKRAREVDEGNAPNCILGYTCLNDVTPFDKINPSSENIAATIYGDLQPRLAGAPVSLSCVEVWESPESWVAYSPD